MPTRRVPVMNQTLRALQNSSQTHKHSEKWGLHSHFTDEKFEVQEGLSHLLKIKIPKGRRIFEILALPAPTDIPTDPLDHAWKNSHSTSCGREPREINPHLCILQN